MMPSSPLDDLPPEFGDSDLEDRVRAGVASSGRTVVVLDDDPTGVQTVHDVAVLAKWQAHEIAAELERDAPAFFVLTNTRSLTRDEAATRNRDIVRNLIAAANDTGKRFAIASRSDSTLRGHYPAETDALSDELGGVDGVLICPAFFEGGRITVDDVHYLRDGDRFVPVAETEFARDSLFGYRHSNLRAWVEEKTSGRISASEVVSISIPDIRLGGPGRVADLLKTVGGGRPVVINAAAYSDLWVTVLGLLEAEAAGKRFIYRTSASFVRARAGISERGPLNRRDLLGPLAPPITNGLVIVGSHVQRTTDQLNRLLELPNLAPIDVDVNELAGGGAVRRAQIQDAAAAAEAALTHGLTPVVFTTREVRTGASGQVEFSRAVSDGLVAIVEGIERRPAFIVAKGGITSSDIGTEALGVRRAMVLGQIRPGVPVWRLGEETRYPGLPYVVFPGNVGTVETLADVVTELRGSK